MMKNIPLPLMRFTLGLGLVLTAANLASAQATVPTPTLFFDFDSADGHTVQSTGKEPMGLDMYKSTANSGAVDVATYESRLGGISPSGPLGGSALDLSGSQRMGGSGQNHGYGGGAVGDPLTDFVGAQSMTLAGWFYTKTNSIGNSAHLIDTRGTAGNAGFSLAASSAGKLRLTVAGVQFESDAVYGDVGSWVFFAVTFDNSAPGNAEVNFYIGGIDAPVSVASTALNGTVGDITLGHKLTIGNQARAEDVLGTTRPFQGYLDNIGLWGSEDGSSALTLEQLEGLRMQQIPEPASAAYLLGAFAGVLVCLNRRSVRS